MGDNGQTLPRWATYLILPRHLSFTARSPVELYLRKAREYASATASRNVQLFWKEVVISAGRVFVVKLLDHHLADLRNSDLSDETIEVLGFYSGRL